MWSLGLHMKDQSMIRMEQNIPSSETSSLKLFTEPSDVSLTENNVHFYMEKVELTARKYARRQFRSHDEQFVNECIAEAYFWLVIIFLEHKEELKQQEDTIAYIRMKIGYKLKEYWAPYATSTISYIKKKGEVLPQKVEFKEAELPKEDQTVDCIICLQSVLKLKIEEDIYNLLLENKTIKEIAVTLKVKIKKVEKHLARIRKRLKNEVITKYESNNS